MSNSAHGPITSISCGPDMLAAALAYAGAGFAVFPLHHPMPEGSCSCARGTECSRTGKHPRTPNGLKDATTDEAQIRRWWTLTPDANIGIATGRASGVFVLDVDGDAGRESINRLEEVVGSLPVSMTVRTGRGYHVYFRCPEESVKNQAPIQGYPHLDCRGEGGYVVAAPSLHASGARYAVDPCSSSEVAYAPEPLVRILTQPRLRTATLGNAVAANEAQIEEGGRNSRLTSVAGKLRRAGLSRTEIEAALLKYNEAHCSPPLDEDEVTAIATSVSKYVAGTPDDVRRTLTDSGNAKRFALAAAGNVAFVPEIGKWLVWRETHWSKDGTGEVIEVAKRVAHDIYLESDAQTDASLRTEIAKHAKNSANQQRLKAMVELAKSEPSLVVSNSKLDSKRGLLGVQNGVVDLSTGQLRPACREDYITMLAPVIHDVAAECPMFRQFLSKITGGTQELMDYLQRVVGYSISGYTEEQVMFFMYGTGANGKSTFINLIGDLLGDALVRTIPSETLSTRNMSTGATPEIARLAGARIASSSEVEEGAFLKESLIKQLTGGDLVTARHLYQEAFEFRAQFKLYMVGNHKPVIRGTDDGIWRRMHLIPFVVQIPADERDPALPNKLRSELPGILNWAIEGYVKWRRDGLRPPAAVTEAVHEYQVEMDVLGQWIAEACEVRYGLSVAAADAYDSYRIWAGANGHRPWSKTTWGQRMTERFSKTRSNRGNVYVGVRPHMSASGPSGGGDV